MEARARKRAEQGKRTRLFKLMKQHDRTRLTSSIWARALEEEDEVAIEIVERALAALGAGVASAINVLDVEAVIVGGGLGTRFGQPYADRIAAAMQPHLFHDSRPPDVRVAGLGDPGGAIGAALLVLRVGTTPPRSARPAAPRARTQSASARTGSPARSPSRGTARVP
jgi:glucokinase